MSNLAQAHATHEAAHEIAHLMGDVALDSASDAEHDEHCGTTHCCHSMGVPPANAACLHFEVVYQRPAMAPTLTPLTPPPEIERPKWDLATHAVASF